MKQITYDAITKETTIIDVPDVETHVVTPEPDPDPDAELAEAISAATTLTQLRAALLGNNGIAKVKGRMK